MNATVIIPIAILVICIIGGCILGEIGFRKSKKHQ